eukprot:SAG25_NODE_1985_length_2059_cov_2.356633_2_plen_88_part_00
MADALGSMSPSSSAGDVLPSSAAAAAAAAASGVGVSVAGRLHRRLHLLSHDARQRVEERARGDGGGAAFEQQHSEPAVFILESVHID